MKRSCKLALCLVVLLAAAACQPIQPQTTDAATVPAASLTATPAEVAAQKIKKGSREELSLTLRKTPDILASLATVKPRPFIVAFAAETQSVEDNAREKLQRKGADLIVANDVSDKSIGFDAEQNEVLIIDRDGGTMRAESSDASAAIGLNELSLCQASLRSR